MCAKMLETSRNETAKESREHDNLAQSSKGLRNTKGSWKKECGRGISSASLRGNRFGREGRRVRGERTGEI